MGIVRDAIINLIRKDRDVDSVLKIIGLDGGKGSGNFGHHGRPGIRGGSAKRGGGGGVSKEREKAIKKQKDNFKKLSRDKKAEYLRNLGHIPVSISKFDDDVLKQYAQKHNMSVDDYLDWRASRMFTMRKFQPEIEYKTPLKNEETQNKPIYKTSARKDYVKEKTGCSDEVVEKMYEGLQGHFGSSSADCKWTDRYIDADGRYDGPIYRWKHYSGNKAKNIVKDLVPGAKIQNPHESNWSFSSDPWQTAHFGDYDEHDVGSDDVTIRYTCDKNITASPVQCISGFGESEAEVIPHSKTTWTITDVEKVEMPNGGVMYDVHMVEDDWHEERGIPVWKPTGNEVQGGWVEDFPKDDSGASNVYESIKNTVKTDDDVLKKFKGVCPDGTEFYQVTDDTIYFMKKNEHDEWVGADITKKFNDNVQKFLDNEVPEISDEWSQLDKDIWSKLEKSGEYKRLSTKEVDDILKDDGTMMLQVGGINQYINSDEKIQESLQKLKDGNPPFEPKEFFDSLPEGTEFYDIKDDETFKKINNTTWQVTEAETGSFMMFMDNSDMFYMSIDGGHDLVVSPKKKDDQSSQEKKVETPKQEKYMSPAEKHQNFLNHDTYGGVSSTLVDFKGGSEKLCEEWVSGFKEGTVFQQNLSGKPGQLLVSEGNGKWGLWKPNDSFKSDTVDDNFVAWCLTNQDLDFTIKNIPLNVPDNSHDADSVFKGIKVENPNQMEAFAYVVPDGTMVMDIQGGYVYCKQKNKWEALNYEFDAPLFNPEDDWSDYDDKTIKNLDQKSIPGKFNGDGTFVLKMGKKKG